MSDGIEVKTESLAEAGKILRTRALADERKNYIGAYHRITKEGEKITIRSTDHRQWVRMELQTESGGSGADFDMWLDGKKINQLFTTIDGGQVLIKRDEAGKLSFRRDKFQFAVKPETTPGEVRELDIAVKNAKVLGTMKAVALADVVNWCRPYIFTNSSDPNRQVMTIDEKGTAVAGLQEQFVIAEGLPAVTQISLNEQNASTMEAWLKAIKKEEIEILMTEKNQHLIFREVGSVNYLAMVQEDRRCPKLDGNPDVKEIGDELLSIDRDWLVNRLRMFAIAMEEGMHTVQIEITGKITSKDADKAAPAELSIAVDGEDQAADVLPIVRRKTEKDLKFRVDLQQLLHAAEKLDTLNIKLSYSAEFGALQIENESGIEGGALIHKICMIKTRIQREQKDGKDLKKEKVTKEQVATNTM